MLGQRRAGIADQVEGVPAPRSDLQVHLQRRVQAAQLVCLVELAGGFGDPGKAVVGSAPAAFGRQVRRGLHSLLPERHCAALGRRSQRLRFPVGIDRLQVAAILVIEIAQRGQDLEGLRLVLEVILEAVDFGEQRLRVRRICAGVGRRPCRRLL